MLSDAGQELFSIECQNRTSACSQKFERLVQGALLNAWINLLSLVSGLKMSRMALSVPMEPGWGGAL